MLAKVELSFQCPLCDANFGAKNLRGHLKRKHAGMSKEQFISALQTAAASGHSVVERKRVVLKEVNASPVTAFSSGGLASARRVSIVPGGAIGLGKKK